MRGLLPLPGHADLRFLQSQIVAVQVPHLLRSQALQEYQAHDGQIA
jgi:hypothetical protein